MKSPTLALYRATTRLLTPLARQALVVRGRRGKEDRARIGERLGQASLDRPDGKLVWLHGASIGEGLVLLPLAVRLVERGFSALVTTGTKSSAAVVGARLPAGAFHQYIPLDAPRFVKRFLDHWRPDLAIFAESELWPNLLDETHARGAPVVLVNARMSPRSYLRWRNVPKAAHALLEKIEVAFAQSNDDAARLLRLGAPRVQIAGNLKYDVAAPPASPETVAEFSSQIGARPVWVAASTHDGEEDICFDVHLQLMKKHPALVTIVAPRDPQRGDEIVEAAKTKGLRVARRSARQRIDRTTQIYLADTFGEMGLWYRLAGIAFMGKSLPDKTRLRGGHNPIEAARLGASVLHGPSVDNFQDAYVALDGAGASAAVADGRELSARLDDLFSNVAKARAMARAGVATIEELCGATDRVMQGIEPYLVHIAMEGAR
ncbi:MAG: 3-deoxy-D-manno-octulosonic acid transferase [Beijerinckiaceae bacterium]